MRPIDADRVKDVMEATLKVLKLIFLQREQQEHLIAAFNTVRLIVDDAETVDAVPVVRCKDCRHRKGRLSDRVQCEHFNCWFPFDFYCYWGERKDA